MFLLVFQEPEAVRGELRQVSWRDFEMPRHRQPRVRVVGRTDRLGPGQVQLRRLRQRVSHARK